MKAPCRLRLILASGSPRRSQLLAEAGFEFEVIKPQVVETSSSALTLREATVWNSLRKGLAVARTNPDAVVLAADTLVGLGHQIIGKPGDRADAVRILRLLSGETHDVSSGVFIAHLRAGKTETFSVISRVTFKKLSDKTIETYLSKIDPLDKAGAYAAQGVGGTIIARLTGSRSNVIGLPMEKTNAALARFGVCAVSCVNA
jgi:septum formation protein